jgi:DNA repair protein RecO (recombination protein O)
MITDGLDAWILHKRWSGETSAAITFFTREKGVVNALYKGARTKKKQAVLQSFIPLSLILDERQNSHYVRQLDATAQSLTLTGDALFAGIYLNELIYKAFKPSDVNMDLFDTYQQSLFALTDASERQVVEVILRRFEWQFLAASGYQMSMTKDAISGQPILFDKRYDFIPGVGFVMAAVGILGASILALDKHHFGVVNELNVAKWMMRRAIDHVLCGVPIKARDLYKSR